MLVNVFSLVNVRKIYNNCRFNIILNIAILKSIVTFVMSCRKRRVYAAMICQKSINYLCYCFFGNVETI